MPGTIPVMGFDLVGHGVRGHKGSGFAAVETTAVARLGGGDLPYILRRSSRASRLRVTIHPDRGVMVTVPSASHPQWGRPEGMIAAFLAEREPWVRRHLARQAAMRAALAGRLAIDDGRLVLFRGQLHRVRVIDGRPGLRSSGVARVGGDEGDELVVERAARDRRPTATILERWLRARARTELERAIERHAAPLGVHPTRLTIRDTTSRWGSCSRRGALSFSWRLVLAPPEALDTVAAHELCHLRVFGHSDRFWTLLEGRVPEHATWRRWLRTHATELHAALD